MTPSARAAEYKRQNRQYVFHWRAFGQETVVGAANAAARLGITEATLGVYLSSGRCAKGWEMVNPNGDVDHVAIDALPPPRMPRVVEELPAKPRGRPRKDLGPADVDPMKPTDWRAAQSRNRPKV